MITRGEDIMQVAVYPDPYLTAAVPDAQAYSRDLIENTIEQYNGTPLKEVPMFGSTFFTTSMTAEGKDQTTFAGVKNGEVFNFVMAGKDNQQNPELKAMLESITFK